MPEIEVFSTDIAGPRAAARLLRQLRQHFPTWRISFDLADCDRVLRVESPDQRPDAAWIAQLLHESGYHCRPLPD
jgi:DNA-binding transcriptional LysR family regulator